MEDSDDFDALDTLYGLMEQEEEEAEYADLAKEEAAHLRVETLSANFKTFVLYAQKNHQLLLLDRCVGYQELAVELRRASMNDRLKVHLVVEFADGSLRYFNVGTSTGFVFTQCTD